MPKERMLIYGVILFVLAVIGYVKYGGVESDKPADTAKATEVEHNTPAVEVSEDVRSVVKKKDIEAVSDVEEESISSVKPDTTETVKSDENEEREDERPSVKRNQLIGGADVVWEEPKPKDPNNKFGEPPM